MQPGGKPVSEILCLEKLQENDNTEWTLFMGYFGYKMLRYVRSITRGSRFDDDIVANALADVCVLRHTYKTMEDMINHLFASVKYEAYNVLYRYGARFVMDEEGLIETASPPALDATSLGERGEYERWKDSVREAVREQAQRLPRKVREFILVYLDGNREDAKAKRKEFGINEDQYKGILARIRDMIETSKSSGRKTQDQLEAIRLAFRYLARQEKMVFAQALQCETIGEICDKLGETRTAVTEALGRCIRKLRTVWKDPILEHATQRLHKIRSLYTPELAAIIEDELRRESGKSKHIVKLTRKQIDDIILMREQEKLSWDEIGRRMDTESKVVKRAYLEDNIETDAAITGLLLADVIAFRRLYRSGETTISAISAQYGIPRGRVVALVEGMDWKIVGKVVTLEPKKELTSDDPAMVSRILELHDKGYTHTQVAAELNCKNRVIMRIVNAHRKKRNNVGKLIPAMLAKGMSVEQIVEELKCTRNAVKYYLPKH
jgi:DNA-directed RNA polymerase specialized sigma24 family protein